MKNSKNKDVEAMDAENEKQFKKTEQTEEVKQPEKTEQPEKSTKTEKPEETEKPKKAEKPSRGNVVAEGYSDGKGNFSPLESGERVGWKKYKKYSDGSIEL